MIPGLPPCGIFEKTLTKNMLMLIRNLKLGRWGNTLIRIYTKDPNEGIRIRRERQEYPNKRFDEAIEEKLRILEVP
ncbi:MAG: hypothetical protein WCA39_07125 [Nitrososphaeraceae archaeon]